MMDANVGWLVGPLLCFRMKYLNNYFRPAATSNQHLTLSITLMDDLMLLLT